MNVLANSEEAVVLVPVALEPVQIQVPLAGVLVEVSHVPVAVRIHPDRAVTCEVSPTPLSLEYS